MDNAVKEKCVLMREDNTVVSIIKCNLKMISAHLGYWVHRFWMPIWAL